MDDTAAIPESALPIVTKTIESMSVLRNKIKAMKQNGTLTGEKAVKISNTYAKLHSEMIACIDSIKNGGDLARNKETLGVLRAVAGVYVRIIAHITVGPDGTWINEDPEMGA